MSDNPTRETPDSRSFEERVFARFDALDQRMTGVENRLISLEDKVDRIDVRLTALEEKMDARLRETRPIWEAVLTRLDGVETRLDSIETRLGNVEGGVKSFGAEMKLMNRTIKLLHEDNLPIRAGLKDLDERVEKLESERAG